MMKKYQVFISSTYEDLKAERLAVSNTILEMDCIPAGMEAFCAQDEEQFEVIKKVIDLCDYYILIIANRYGSINPKTGLSYTEMEYDYAKEQGIPVMVFKVKEKSKYESDNQDEKLAKFIEKAFNGRMGSVWSNSDNLCTHVATSLAKAKTEYKRPGWTRANVYDQTDLLNQLNEARIQKDAAEKKMNDLKKKLEATEADNKKMKEHIDAFNDVSNLELRKEPITVIYTNDSTHSDVVKNVYLSDIFAYVSIQIIDVALAVSYIDDLIAQSFGAKNSSHVSDKTLIPRIRNEFKQLGLMYTRWVEKKDRQFYGLTEKGKILRDKLNSFSK